MIEVMESRYEHSPEAVAAMNTDALRDNFLLTDLMKENEFSFLYTHYDRCIIGTIVPVSGSFELPNFDNLKAAYFLERREMGILNIGGDGEVLVDGKSYSLQNLDALYVGKGNTAVSFRSVDAAQPAKFYLYSVPAHQSYPVQFMEKSKASPVALGARESANVRTIYKYIHKDGLQSCQLVMGVTVLNTGSIWNTMPAHIHDRRMEAYLYFDLPEDQVVFHFMGEPQQTRHLVVKNNQAIISPPWSVHSGVGTSSYSFVWAMAGENKDFTDMDMIKITDLR